MKNNTWIYKAIEDYKNSDESWIKELWELTEKYFNNHVLPLLVFYPLTDDDEAHILFHGFENILYRYKAERSVDMNFGLLTGHVFEEKKKAALDKTDIGIKLFSAFHGFTFIAVKGIELLKNTINKKERIAMESWREMNKLYQDSKIKLTMAENRIINLEGSTKSIQKIKTGVKKVGVKPKYGTEAKLHTAIGEIKGWENMSTSQISLALKLSKNRLAQILDETGWSLPPKE